MEVNTNLYYLIRFIAEVGRAPKARETYEGKNIGWFYQNIKHGQYNLSDEDKAFFERLGINLATKNPQVNVHEKLLILVEFISANERIPKYNERYKGINLGVFFRNILSGNTSLSKADKKLLDSKLHYIRG